MKSIGKAGPAVGSALLLAACSGGGGGEASPSAAATPFGTALDQALAPVGTDFAMGTSATSAFDLDTPLTHLASDANRAARNVNAATAPAGATAALAKLRAVGYRTAFAVPELPEPHPRSRSLDNGAFTGSARNGHTRTGCCRSMAQPGPWSGELCGNC